MEWLSNIKDLVLKGSVYMSFIILGKKINENALMQETIEKQQKALKTAALPSLSWNGLLDWVRGK